LAFKKLGLSIVSLHLIHFFFLGLGFSFEFENEHQQRVLNQREDDAHAEEDEVVRLVVQVATNQNQGDARCILNDLEHSLCDVLILELKTTNHHREALGDRIFESKQKAHCERKPEIELVNLDVGNAAP
jgi:hypothetical protein